MSPSRRVEVEGGARLSATLARASAAVGHLERPNAAAGGVVVNAARGNAPHRTGRLASSLTARPSGTGTTVGSTLPYAAPIHWGWPAHGIEPNPFAANAAQTTETRWVAEYARHVDSALAGVKGK